MSNSGKITARLRPDVDRRLRATAALQGERIGRIVNEALDRALPSLREIGVMVSEGEPADGDRS